MSGQHFVLIDRMVRWAALKLEQADPLDEVAQVAYLRAWNYWQARWLRALGGA